MMHGGWIRRIGQKLTMDNLGDLKQMIDECIQNPKYAKGRQEAREETWEYMGEGTQRAVDYLLNKYESLKQAAGGR